MTTVTDQDLRARWQALPGLLGAGADVLDDQLLGQLLSAHQCQGRHYHSERHVLAVLQHLDVLAHRATDEVMATLGLAAFFHDAVYDATSDGSEGSNEERSARLAEERLHGLPKAVVADVARLIRATEGHALAPVPLAAAFLDADLAILGAPPDVYDAYALNIRREYSHVPEELYRSGRATVLESFLGRDRLYFTSQAVESWERVARSNLYREINQLTHA